MEGKGHKVWWVGMGGESENSCGEKDKHDRKLMKLSVGRSFSSQHHDIQAKKCERCPDAEIMSFC